MIYVLFWLIPGFLLRSGTVLWPVRSRRALWRSVLVGALSYAAVAVAEPARVPLQPAPGTPEWSAAVENVRQLGLKELPKALEEADRLLAIVAQSPHPAGELELLNVIARTLVVGGRVAQASELADRAITLAQTQGDRRAEGLALYNKMGGLALVGRYQEALALAPPTMRVLRDNGDARTRHLATAMLGIVHRRLGLFDEAITVLMDGLNEAERAGAEQDPALVARYHNALGTLYSDIGDSERAISHFERALTGFQKVSDLPAASTALGNIGLSAIKLGQHARSAEALGEAVAIKRRVGDEAGLPGVLFGLGESLVAMKKYDEARAAAEESIALSLAQNASAVLPPAYIVLAQSLRARGEREQAVEALLRGLAAAKTSGNLVFEKQVHEELSETYAEIDGETRALREAREASGLEERIASEESRKRLVDLDRRYETARKDRELADLRLRNQHQDAEIAARRARQKLWLSISIVTAAGLVLSGGLLIQLRRKHWLLHNTHGQLSRAMADLHAAQDKLVEASRVAGAAEVAAGVVHHVGHVLNSVNVSIGVMHERVSRSRAPQLQRLAGLFGKPEELQAYLSDEEKSRTLIQYLDQLGHQLNRDRTEFTAELTQLRGYVEDIIRVVRSQEEHIRFGSLNEQVFPVELVDSAVRLAQEVCKEAWTIERVYSAVPPVHLDRRKIMQVLSDLIVRMRGDLLVGCDPPELVRLSLRTVAGWDHVVVEIAFRRAVSDALIRLGSLIRVGGTLHEAANILAEQRGRISVPDANPPETVTVILELPTSP